LNPDQVFPYFNLVETLQRVPEAQRTIKQALARNLDDPELHVQLYRIAMGRGDRAIMSAQRAWAAGKPTTELTLRILDAEMLAAAGRAGAARDLFARAETEATGAAAKQMVQTRRAWIEAAMGEVGRARQTLARIDASQRSIALVDAVNAAALVNERARAEAFAAGVPKASPGIAQNMVANALALLQIQSGNRTAVDNVRPFLKGELLPVGPALRPIYIRATLFRRAGAAQQAIAEFTRILEHPQTAPRGSCTRISLRVGKTPIRMFPFSCAQKRNTPSCRQTDSLPSAVLSTASRSTSMPGNPRSTSSSPSSTAGAPSPPRATAA